jgi:hypothetical protein
VGFPVEPDNSDTIPTVDVEPIWCTKGGMIGSAASSFTNLICYSFLQFQTSVEPTNPACRATIVRGSPSAKRPFEFPTAAGMLSWLRDFILWRARH